MAVAFDAGSEGEADPGASLTIAHTVSGSDRVLYCAITHSPGGDEVDQVTATYNGTAMDVMFTDMTTHGSRRVRVFRLVEPATGTNDVVFSWGGGSQSFRAVCASFTGVDQADPDDAHVLTDGSGGGTSTSRSVTSATDDMVMDVVVMGNGVTGLTVDGGQTEINQILAGGITNGIGASYEAGATSVTVGWSWTGFVAYVQWAWNINASAGGGGGGGGTTITGLGRRMLGWTYQQGGL